MIDELYLTYRPELLKYCCMICGNVSDAEDLLQETFLRALNNLDTLEELNEKQRRSRSGWSCPPCRRSCRSFSSGATSRTTPQRSWQRNTGLPLPASEPP